MQLFSPRNCQLSHAFVSFEVPPEDCNLIALLLSVLLFKLTLACDSVVTQVPPCVDASDDVCLVLLSRGLIYDELWFTAEWLLHCANLEQL